MIVKDEPETLPSEDELPSLASLLRKRIKREAPSSEDDEPIAPRQRKRRGISPYCVHSQDPVSERRLKPVHREPKTSSRHLSAGNGDTNGNQLSSPSDRAGKRAKHNIIQPKQPPNDEVQNSPRERYKVILRRDRLLDIRAVPPHLNAMYVCGSIRLRVTC